MIAWRPSPPTVAMPDLGWPARWLREQYDIAVAGYKRRLSLDTIIVYDKGYFTYDKGAFPAGEHPVEGASTEVVPVDKQASVANVKLVPTPNNEGIIYRVKVPNHVIDKHMTEEARWIPDTTLPQYIGAATAYLLGVVVVFFLLLPIFVFPFNLIMGLIFASPLVLFGYWIGPKLGPRSIWLMWRYHILYTDKDGVERERIINQPISHGVFRNPEYVVVKDEKGIEHSVARVLRATTVADAMKARDLGDKLKGATIRMAKLEVGALMAVAIALAGLVTLAAIAFGNEGGA